MKTGVLIAIIAAIPPTLAAILGYRANARALRRSIGTPPGVPLTRIVERLEHKIDRLAEGQTVVRERLARLEGEREAEGRRAHG